MKINTEKEKTETPILEEKKSDMPLMSNNFWLMAIAGALIVVGFVLMTGSSSGIEEFNPDIFSTRRIVVGPTLSFLGFVLMGIAIIVKPKAKK